MRLPALRFVLLGIPMILLSGCGGGGNEIWVTGKITKGGAKYTPPEGRRISVFLHALEAKDATGKDLKYEPFQASLGADGESFTVPGKDGYGIAPGKYRISIIEKINREALDASKNLQHKGKKVERDTDFLDDQFSAEKSPIVRDVDGSKPLLIDLDKPTEG